MNFSLSLVIIALFGWTSPANPVWAESDRSIGTTPPSSVSANPASRDSASAEGVEESDKTSSAPYKDFSGTTSAVSASDILPAGDALPDTLGLVTRMGLSLLAVIFLIWGAVQILKKFSPGGAISSGGATIRVLDRAYIAPKKSIYVVQIGNKVLALGVTDQQMTTLTDLDLEDTLAQVADTSSRRVTRRFSDVLKTVNARFTRHSEEPAT